MITHMAASLIEACPDFHTLHRLGHRRLEQSVTERLAATLHEYACLNDPDAGIEAGVKETVVYVHLDPGQQLTAPDATAVLRAAGTGSAGACHYVVSADAYSDDFAAALDAITAPDATITLIDRSIMDRWNEDRAAIHRLAVAENVLLDRPPAEVLIWDLPDPEEHEMVADQMASVLYQVCAAAVAFHGPVDVSGGVERVWGQACDDCSPVDRRYLALMALNVASGAVEGIVPGFEDDPAAIERLRDDVQRVFDDVRQTFHSTPQ